MATEITETTETGIVPYSGAEELREQHAQLLEQRQQNDDGAEFHRRVAGFIARGVATGAYIDTRDERRAIQSLLDYWVNVLDRAHVEAPEPKLAEFDPSLAPDLSDKPCPYQGLEAFRENKSDFFFGREAFVDRLIERLRRDRLLALVGSSGSGKSSLVFAGVLPELKAGEGATWRYLTMAPGTEPLANLSRAMVNLAPAHAAFDLNTATKITFAEQGFRREPDYLATVANELSDQPVVLVVDQFEELFTLCDDEETRKVFTDQLIGLIRSQPVRHLVILTMRTDYTPRVATLPDFKDLFDEARVDVTEMGIPELRAAIEKPAAKVGLKFDEGVVDDLIKTILGVGSGLPLLQFTLLKLWEERDRNRITREVYRQVGNPLQALGRSADEFYDKLSLEDQRLVRRILLRMVRPGEGNDFTSRRIPAVDAFRGERQDSVERVLGLLINEARLVKLSGIGAGVGANGSVSNGASPQGLTLESLQPSEAGVVPQIEVAHEALVRNWTLLDNWLNEERDRLKDQRWLVQEAARWRDDGRNPARLLRERALEDAERVLKADEQYGDLGELEREFVLASRDAVQAAIRAEKERQARELQQAQALAEEQRLRADAERLRAEEAARDSKRLRRLAAALVGVAVLAGVLALMALLAQGQAMQQQRFAEANAQLAATREAEAIEARGTAESAKSTAEAGEAGALKAQQIEASARQAAVVAQQEAEKNKSLAEQSAIQERLAKDVANSRQFAAEAENLLDVSATQALSAALNSVLVTRTAEAETALRKALEAPLPRRVISGALVFGAQLSPDGKRIVTIGENNVAYVWNAQTGQKLAELNLFIRRIVVFNSAQFSPDNRFIVTANDDGLVRLWDANSGEPIAEFVGHEGAVNGAEFSQDGRRIVSAGADQTARIWDVQSRQEISSARMLGHTAVVNSASFSTDGQRVITASDDGTARVWDANTGRQIGPPLGDIDAPVLVRIKSAHFASAPIGPPGLVYTTTGAPDQRAVTAGEDGFARIWDVDRGRIIALLGRHEGPVLSAQFSSDGTRVLTASDDGSARIWDAVTGQQLKALRGHVNAVLSAQFSTDGRQALTASADNTAQLWDLQSSVSSTALRGHQGPANGAQFSPDGQRIASASSDFSARIWDVNTGKQLALLRDHALEVNDVAFSPDGKRLVTAGNDGAVRIWDVESGTEVITPLLAHAGPVYSAQFSPDGKWIVSASADQTALVWNVSTQFTLSEVEGLNTGALTGTVVVTLTGHQGGVNYAQFSPNGERVATASSDGTARVWDAVSGKEIITLLGHEGALNSVKFSPDGTLILTAGDDGTARLWDAATGKPLMLLQGHDGPVNYAAFSNDGKRVVTAGTDLTARVWTLAPGKDVIEADLVVRGHEGRVTSAQFSPDDQFIVTASDDNTVRIHPVRVTVQDLIHLACSRLESLQLRKCA
jgi:WD40 repeat protein